MLGFDYVYVLTAIIVLSTIAGCPGGQGSPRDGGSEDGDTDTPDTAPSVCSTHADCSDGIFCNGAESCSPSDREADPRGCLPASDLEPCLDGQTCSEAEDRCLSDCDAEPDRDGDGHAAENCDGDDCDDADRNRYPGNVEVCDTDHRDEDCDPRTYGFRDGDGDGHPDSRCCNVEADGELNCGPDCDDDLAFVYPGAPELCNDLDDDCDGEVDEDRTDYEFYPDCDGDRHGAAGAAPQVACEPPVEVPDCDSPSPSASWIRESHDDCDDREPDVNPGNPEVCDSVGIDEDCDSDTFGRTDSDGDDFISNECCNSQLDGTLLCEDDCDDDDEAIHPGAAELCNGHDDDCDGEVDEAPGVLASCPTIPGVEIACVDGTCAIADCPEGRADCDGDIETGCEVDTISDPSNCGACDSACHLACHESSCDEAVEVSAGSDHTCALLESGRVVCWGANMLGQLGNGATLESSIPVMVAGLDDAIGISAGYEFNCAVRSGGQVSCWGSNHSGQLGDGTTTTRLTPTNATGIHDALEVSAGTSHACAVRTTGRVMCWGRNEWGRLGNGTTTDSSTPVAVSGITDAEHVACGYNHSCASRSSVWMRCWGDNMFHQLGDGTTADRSIPVAVEATSPPGLIFAGTRNSCSLLSTGSGVTVWGRNDRGQLGNGRTTDIDIPVWLMMTPGDIVLASLGTVHSCLLRRSGGIRCSGSNEFGQLGEGTTTNRMTFEPVVGIADASWVAAGQDHSCAVRESGQVVCWGRNSDGQLGNGTRENATIPVVVSRPAPADEVVFGNDECDGAFVIPTSSGRATFTGSTSLATNSEGSCSSAPDVWFELTLERSEVVLIHTYGSSFDTMLGIRAGGCGGDATECNDDSCTTVQSELVAELEAGTHVIIVDGFGTRSGDFRLAIERLPIGNDGVARSLPAGRSSHVSTTSGTGVVDGACRSGVAPEHLYYWTQCPSAAGGDLAADTCSDTDYDTVLYFLSGGGGSLACDDDACGPGSRIEATVPDGAGLFGLYVDGYDDRSGGYSLSVVRP